MSAPGTRGGPCPAAPTDVGQPPPLPRRFGDGGAGYTLRSDLVSMASVVTLIRQTLCAWAAALEE